MIMTNCEMAGKKAVLTCCKRWHHIFCCSMAAAAYLLPLLMLAAVPSMAAVDWPPQPPSPTPSPWPLPPRFSAGRDITYDDDDLGGSEDSISSISSDDTDSTATDGESLPALMGDGRLRLNRKEVSAISRIKYEIKKSNKPKENCQLFMNRTCELLKDRCPGVQTGEQRELFVQQLSDALRFRKTDPNGLIAFLNNCSRVEPAPQQELAGSSSSSSSQRPGDADRRAGNNEQQQQQLERVISDSIAADLAATVQQSMVSEYGEQVDRLQSELAAKAEMLHEYEARMRQLEARVADKSAESAPGNASTNYRDDGAAEDDDSEGDTDDDQAKHSEVQHQLDTLHEMYDECEMRVKQVVRQELEAREESDKLRTSVGAIEQKLDQCWEQIDIADKQRDDYTKLLEGSLFAPASSPLMSENRSQDDDHQQHQQRLRCELIIKGLCSVVGCENDYDRSGALSDGIYELRQREEARAHLGPLLSNLDIGLMEHLDFCARLSDSDRRVELAAGSSQPEMVPANGGPDSAGAESGSADVDVDADADKAELAEAEAGAEHQHQHQHQHQQEQAQVQPHQRQEQEQELSELRTRVESLQRELDESRQLNKALHEQLGPILKSASAWSDEQQTISDHPNSDQDDWLQVAKKLLSVWKARAQEAVQRADQVSEAMRLVNGKLEQCSEERQRLSERLMQASAE